MAGTSYGLIEVSGVVAAIDSLDAMCKAAEVELVTWERKLGGRLVTIIVEGTVSDVKAAVEAVAENLGEDGRILVRESGTEPVVRVMVEADTMETCEKLVDQVIEVIKNKGYAV